MKKLFAVFFTVLLAVHFVNAQNNWINYRIDDKLSCKMPSEPSADGDFSVMAKTADSVVCIITTIDFQKAANIDSATLATLASQSKFAAGMKQGVQDKLPGFTLGDIRAAKWNNYYCYTIEGENAKKTFRIYTFMVLVGTRFYSLSALLPHDKDPKPKDDFFASLRLN